MSVTVQHKLAFSESRLVIPRRCSLILLVLLVGRCDCGPSPLSSRDEGSSPRQRRAITDGDASHIVCGYDLCDMRVEFCDTAMGLCHACYDLCSPARMGSNKVAVQRCTDNCPYYFSKMTARKPSKVSQPAIPDDDMAKYVVEQLAFMKTSLLVIALLVGLVVVLLLSVLLLLVLRIRRSGTLSKGEDKEDISYVKHSRSVGEFLQKLNPTEKRSSVEYTGLIDKRDVLNGMASYDDSGSGEIAASCEARQVALPTSPGRTTEQQPRLSASFTPGGATPHPQPKEWKRGVSQNSARPLKGHAIEVDEKCMTSGIGTRNSLDSVGVGVDVGRFTPLVHQSPWAAAARNAAI